MNNQQQLQKVKDKYDREGYEVVVLPRGEDIPSFARAYEPDLIATKGGEKVIVQVKKDRSDLAKDRSLARLAEITNAQPGWRFDLVILEAQSPMEELASQADEPSINKIEQLLAHAEQSAEAGDTLSAFVVAWSGLEAALRYRSRAAGLGHAKPVGATVLIRTLYSSGFLSSAELRRLDKANRTRNQIVHGFVTSRIGRNEVDYVVSLARRLLQDKSKPNKDD
jgi:hypothetical protein